MLSPECFQNAPANVTEEITAELATRHAAVAEGRLEQAVRRFYTQIPPAAEEELVVGGIWVRPFHRAPPQRAKDLVGDEKC